MSRPAASDQSFLPVSESKASNSPVICPENTTPPAVDSTPRQAKKQLRQEVSERVERGGAMTDQTVTDIWTEALGYVRDYVARTLNKS